MSSYDLLATVTSQVSRFEPFRKFSKDAKESFAFDITLVALSIRTGYLLDRISIEEPLVVNTFSTLLKELCRTSKCFDETLHLYEPIANQSFIVNKSLLFRKLELLLTQYASNPYPIFLLLQKRGEICQFDTVPKAVFGVLELLFDKLTGSHLSAEERTVQLPQGLVSTTFVPLAAILLDYPVAYVPSSENQVSFLNSVPLVVFRCQINTQKERVKGLPVHKEEHNFLAFSCPTSLADDTSSNASIQRIITHLESSFGPRIAESFPRSTLHAGYKHITLDCVAL